MGHVRFACRQREMGRVSGHPGTPSLHRRGQQRPVACLTLGLPYPIPPSAVLGPCSQCVLCCTAPRPPRRQHPVSAAPQEAAPSLQQAAQDSTFNHLSTHFAWNSWLQGRTRRSCRASKSLKHTTHLGEAAISAAPLHTHGPLPDTTLSPHQAPPCPPPWAHLQGLLRLVALGVEAVGREVLDVCFGESPWLGLPQPLGQVQQRLQGDAEASSAQFRPQHSTAPGSPHPGRAIPKSPTPSPHGEAEPAYLVILHLHIIHVQV